MKQPVIPSTPIQSMMAMQNHLLHSQFQAVLFVVAVCVLLPAAVTGVTNSVSPNGTIIWGDELPQPGDYKADNDYEPKGLGAMYSMARGFINAVQPSIPAGSTLLQYIHS